MWAGRHPRLICANTDVPRGLTRTGRWCRRSLAIVLRREASRSIGTTGGGVGVSLGPSGPANRGVRPAVRDVAGGDRTTASRSGAHGLPPGLSHLDCEGRYARCSRVGVGSTPLPSATTRRSEAGPNRDTMYVGRPAARWYYPRRDDGGRLRRLFGTGHTSRGRERCVFDENEVRHRLGERTSDGCPADTVAVRTRRYAREVGRRRGRFSQPREPLSRRGNRRSVRRD